MIEVKISIAAPELSEAIVKLAEAIAGQSGKAFEVAGTFTGDEGKTPVQPPVEAHEEAPKAEPAPAPAAPEKPAAHYTPTQLGRAGAELMSQGKTKELIALLGKFGVKALTELKPEEYSAFADGLVQLGAVIPAEAA